MAESVEDEEAIAAAEAAAAAAVAEDSLTDTEGEVDSGRRDVEELNDRHLRLVAEFSNYRRRTEQERLSAWGRAQADVISKFLDVLDDLHRVAQLDLSNATVDAIMEGVDLVEKKFSRMLEDAGVEVIDPAGERFDPQRMEAIMRMPAESAEQDETVALVMQKGYALKGALMRPARVAVYKHG
jgi:molecular chaperone GrpE